MCDRVFQYEYSNGSLIYINADYKSNPELVLDLYLKWYNSDFAPEEHLPLRCYEDFKFVCSFCPIDFYDETRKIVRGY